MTVVTTTAVDVWRFDLDQSPEAAPALMLSDDERAASRSLVLPHQRRRHAICRTLLRVVLARYVGLPPASLEFACGPNDKPRLVGAKIAFNVTHCDALALIAVSRDGPVGIDVESLRRPLSPDGLAHVALGVEERAQLCAVPPPLRRRAFLRLWTRKEAVLKATGAGITEALQSCDVRRDFVEAPDEEGVIRTVEVRDFPIGGPHVSAIAAEGQLGAIHCRSGRMWNGEK